MSRLDIPCPQCGKLLTIPDRSLLGKKGKCSRCQHRFLLHLPETTVAFAEATPETEAADLRTAPPVPGTTPGKARSAVAPQRSAEPAPPVVEPPPVVVASNPAIAVVSETVSSKRAASSRRGRKGRGKLLPWILVAVLLAGGGGGFGWWASQAKPPVRRTAASPEKVPAGKAEVPAVVVQDAGFPLKGNPTHGKPVSLKSIPLGARILLHLRPAELWADTDAAAEFRACLGPVARGIEEQLKANCLFAPENLESVLIALVPISRDAFDTAFVVRTVADFKRSDLIQLFNGELVDEPRPHYVGPERVFLIQDNRTFASAPKSMKETFLEAAGRPLDASEGLETLLARSDADRHFSLVAELEDVRNGIPTLVPAGAQKLLSAVVDFFGDDVEAFLWSFHLGDPELQANFYSDLVVRNRTTRSAANLEKDLKKGLASVPRQILEIARQTHPESIGNSKIIGRFPIMTKVVEQSVQVSHAQRQVAFALELPEIAGPNLASGILLTWDYTTRPSFGTAKPQTPVDDGPVLPIAERLAKKINVEFRNDFLYVALEFIGNETGVKFRTDGPGMQRVGVTQNMRQDMKYENRAATAILHEMLVQKLKDRELCIWIDEANNEVVVTSQVVAEEQKRKIFPLKPQ